MNAFAEIAPQIDDVHSADMTPCPGCKAQIPEPKSTSYCGLGRMEHEWHCHRCGESFRTMARMAGMIELEPRNRLQRLATRGKGGGFPGNPS